MFIDGNAILHIFDIATHFSSATFLDVEGKKYGQSVDRIWLSFVQNLSTIYFGFYNRLRTYQGSVLTSDRWKRLPTLFV